MKREFPFGKSVEEKEKWMAEYYPVINEVKEKCKLGGYCATCMYCTDEDAKLNHYKASYCTFYDK